MYRSTDLLSFKKILANQPWSRDAAVCSFYTKLMVQMTTANPLCGLHIPHAPHLITGAYAAMSECFKKSEQVAFPMPLFPKLPRGVGFGILKI